MSTNSVSIDKRNHPRVDAWPFARDGRRGPALCLVHVALLVQFCTAHETVRQWNSKFKCGPTVSRASLPPRHCLSLSLGAVMHVCQRSMYRTCAVTGAHARRGAGVDNAARHVLVLCSLMSGATQGRSNGNDASSAAL